MKLYQLTMKNHFLRNLQKYYVVIQNIKIIDIKDILWNLYFRSSKKLKFFNFIIQYRPILF
jgi:hypothetical protein